MGCVVRQRNKYSCWRKGEERGVRRGTDGEGIGREKCRKEGKEREEKGGADVRGLGGDDRQSAGIGYEGPSGRDRGGERGKLGEGKPTKGGVGWREVGRKERSLHQRAGLGRDSLGNAEEDGTWQDENV